MVKFIRYIPKPIRGIGNQILGKFRNKYSAELSYWKSRYKIDNGVLQNAHYERLMLAMAGEPDDSFLKGKIVADFGCGPRGSLVWAKSAFLRIGIDVLSDRYADEFTENIIAHGMIYLKSTEKIIPLPSNFVDVMFTLNAMDHVDSFAKVCSEINRVLKPGGDFIGSFNLEGPPNAAEPQRLDEEIIKKNLLNDLDVLSYRTTNLKPDLIDHYHNEEYEPFFKGNLCYDKHQKGFLWVRARKSVNKL